AWTGVAGGGFASVLLATMPNRISGIMSNATLLAVPLFAFMGVKLERPRLADTLPDNLGAPSGRMRGRLGISAALVRLRTAASTGIVGATVVTMGLLSLPTMLRRGYDPRIATGTICAAGTLGQIIPPSIVLVLLGDVMSSAYSQAQLAQGVFAPDTVSVGDLFVGALLPGLMLVGLYMTYIVAIAVVRPAAMPAHVQDGERAGVIQLVLALLPPLVLIV